MKNKDELSETEIVLESSDDQKTITLTIKSESELTTADLVECLEFYLCEITRAHEQKTSPGTEIH